MPAERLAERAADDRREEGPQVYPHVEDGERAIPPRIARRVEASDLGRYIRLERAVAKNEKDQGREEKGLDRHEKMADRHQDAAQDHGAAPSDNPVREHAAEKGRQVDEGGVEPINLG